MDAKQVKDLMDHLETSKLKKLVLKDGEFELQLEKEDAHGPRPSPSRLKVRESEPESAFQSEDCLLYTSPSPRDRTRSRMPSSA